jgi:hypothetical protein
MFVSRKDHQGHHCSNKAYMRWYWHFIKPVNNFTAWSPWDDWPLYFVESPGRINGRREVDLRDV